MFDTSKIIIIENVSIFFDVLKSLRKILFNDLFGINTANFVKVNDHVMLL